MYKTINVYEFRDWFTNSDTYKNNFSWEGLAALFDYLEEYEASTGETVEFDPIALCCEYSEYKSAWEAMEQYQPDDMPVIDMEEHDGIDLVELGELQEQEAREWLMERTTVIPFDGGIIIQQF